MTWQRRARLVLGLFLIAFTAFVYLATRQRPEASDTPVLERLEPEAVSETVGGTWTFSNGETLAFERLFRFADGHERAEGVTIRLPDEDGRILTIAGRRAQQQTPSTSRLGVVTIAGAVEVTTEGGLTILTDEASFDPADDRVRAPGSVRFTRGRLGGSGVGASFDRRLDLLALLDQARVALTPEPDGTGGLDAAAGTAVFSRADHYLRLERNARLEGDLRVVEADEALVHLSEDDARVTLVELRGHARVTPSAPAGLAGSLGTMEAGRMNLRYAEDGRTLTSATLVDRAGLDVGGRPPAGARRVAADRLDLALAPDGTTVTSLTGRGTVELTLPASPDAPGQRISATSLDAKGTARDGLRSAHFSGGVEYREGRAVSAHEEPARVVRSTSLDVSLGGDGGAVESARFAGAVRFTEGRWQAESPAARYAPTDGVVVLTQANGQARPRVADDRLSIDATSIELTAAADRLVATGGVQSVLRPARGPNAGDATRLPAMMDEAQPLYGTSSRLLFDGECGLCQASVRFILRHEPINVTAGALDYDGSVSKATYSGGAQLWQGERSIKATSIVLDSERGGLSAAGRVRTVLMLEERPQGDVAPRRMRSVGEAGSLEYDDDLRRATYREEAHLNGPEGDLRAARLELFLDDRGARVERAEAYDTVTAIIEDRFTATGSRLTYTAGDERYLMKGAPLTVIERRTEGCQETIGTILTFLRSTDTINVDGTEGNRSRTRPVPCAERPR